MASNTENLNLLMKNPSTDGADTFNVQTMLNENWQKIDNNAGTVAQTLANILKPTTPPIIGLPPSTTPDGMFQALGNTGELHVWRKTVVNASEKPAGYTLGAETTKTLGLTRNSDSSSWAITVELASSVSVDDAGNVTLVSPSKLSVYAYNAFADSFSGKFFRLYSIGSSVTGTELANNEVYFVPTGNKLNIRADTSSSKFYLDLGMKLVTGYAKAPAGTTTTYPVSTNPNAYQEGSDAKPAGYVVGDVVTGRFMLEGYFNSSHPTYYIADTKPTVTDDGVVSVNDVYGFGGYNGDKQQLQTLIRGKYIKCRVDDYTSSDFRNLGVVYIPKDTVVLQNSSVDGTYIDRYQPVTGYAAIPAGTTIEYLGKLGDKARVQVLSYVGTGTYGAYNPNSLTFDFVPKAIMVRDNGQGMRFLEAIYGMEFAVVKYSDGSFVSMIWNKKTVSWYSASDPYYQMNSNGSKYFAIAIG